MSFLCDTSILLRLNEPTTSLFKDVKASIDLLRSRVVIVPQVLYEYWVVATRPVTVNGQGLSAESANVDLEKFENLFKLIPDKPEIYSIWKGLVASKNTVGKTAHDARLVAAMKAHDIDAILTLNPRDFERYQDISVWTPKDVLRTEA